MKFFTKSCVFFTYFVNCIISDNFHLSVILLIFHHIFTKKNILHTDSTSGIFFSKTSFSNITIPFKNLGEDQNQVIIFYIYFTVNIFLIDILFFFVE